MRRVTPRVITAGVVLGAALLLAACSGEAERDTPALRAGFASRTVEAGEVTVKLTPQRIDADGATFEIVFDTHTVDLDFDVAANARLLVDGTVWRGATWEGPGPGGHHREGTLGFTAAGEATGTAQLSIDGLPRPVRATWELEGE